MKDVLNVLKAEVFKLSIRGVLTILSIELNPFSSKRKRPVICRYISYTKDTLKGGFFEIGDYTYGVPIVFTSAPGKKLKIGKFCSIASGVTIELGGIHRSNLVTTYPFKAFPDNWRRAKYLKSDEVNAISKGDIIIGNDVWIARGATILSGVRISDGAVIGAGAVVTKDVEPYVIVAGNPAILIRKRFDDETIQKLLEIKWWDWPIEKINENLQIICSADISRMLQLK